ncbi:MAG: asparagine synthase-related protein [Burkholderiales bacterium]
MAAALSDGDAPRCEQSLTEFSGLACKGMVRTSAIVEESGCVLAIYGHPHWPKAGGRTAAIQEVGHEILGAFREHGPTSLADLEGDFALAILNAVANEALLAVDRIGVRNLCYQSDPEGIIFASTLDALGQHPRTKRDLDPQAIYDYLYFHMVPGPRTIFRRQLRVPAGHYAHFRGGQIEVRPYWHMRYAENNAGTVADYKHRLMDALSFATEQCADDVPCGAFLSGGTDSSTITGMMTRTSGKPARTYSIGFDAAGYDEMHFARIAARHFGATHREYYVTPQDVVDSVPMIAKTFDQPFGNASAVPTFYCARSAKLDGVERMLGGDGGDELYGGNARYATQMIYALYGKVPALLRSLAIEPFLFGLPWPEVGVFRKGRNYVRQARLPMPARYETYNLLDRLGRERILTPEFLESIDVRHPQALLEETFRGTDAGSLVNQMLAIDLKFTLADNDLRKVTRMCEAAGMDVAFPMLDERVVDLSRELPAELKVKGTRLRYFFKEALRDFLPLEILSKEKHGFGLPVGIWLSEYPPLSALAREMLGALKERGIVRPDFIEFILGDALREHPSYYGVMVWVMMMLEGWYREHSSNRHAAK